MAAKNSNCLKFNCVENQSQRFKSGKCESKIYKITSARTIQVNLEKDYNFSKNMVYSR